MLIALTTRAQRASRASRAMMGASSVLSTPFARPRAHPARHSHRCKHLAAALREPPTIDHLNPTGLFGNPYLTSPAALRKFTEESLSKAQLLAAQIISGQVEPRDAVLRLDVLSDVICKVVDMAGFVRQSHPDPEMLEATTEAHHVMFDFMNQLNTSHELYAVVCQALELGGLSREEQRVAEILKHDFEKSGLQFNDKSGFVDCSNVVLHLGQEFLDEVGPAQAYVPFHSSQLRGLNPDLIKELSTFTGKVRLPLNHYAEMALSVVEDPMAREKIWRALKSSSRDQVSRLRDLLVHRFGIAAMSGYKSYAAYELTDKLMQTPENVDAFLQSLQKTIKPKAVQELAALAPQLAPHTLAPWDHTYYLHKHNSAKRGLVREASSISSYFSLENVMQGISDVCERLYGIRFEVGTLRAGEVWSRDVRRLDVYEGSTKLGMIYCDLFSRDGKSPNPAHFTIQCARQIWPWEGPVEGQGQGNRQLPIIALVCDFVVHDGRCLLTFNQVQTLFHEMGHAIHSMIGRTDLHNVAGTRCATDFVELPSILMEKFASEPSVLQLFAKHYETGQALPLELFKKVQVINNTTEQWETYHQILLSIIDQRLHSAAAGRSDFDMDAQVRQIISEYSLFPSVFSQQYAQFGHLVSYGATYYSYLLDRCLANKIWDQLFSQDPLSGEGGEQFKNKVLKWGGSRPPLVCLEDVLGEFDFEEVAKHL